MVSLEEKEKWVYCSNCKAEDIDCDGDHLGYTCFYCNKGKWVDEDEDDD